MPAIQIVAHAIKNRVFFDTQRKSTANWFTRPTMITTPDNLVIIAEDFQAGEDVYQVLPGGYALVASMSKDKETGRRNRYTLTFYEWMVPCHGVIRQRVNDCGCLGWHDKGACGHGLALDKIINADALRPILDVCGEVRAAYRVAGTCTFKDCGASGAWHKDRAKDTRPLFRVATYQRKPLPGMLGTGYDVFNLCGECGQRQKGGK